MFVFMWLFFNEICMWVLLVLWVVCLFLKFWVFESECEVQCFSEVVFLDFLILYFEVENVQMVKVVEDVVIGEVFYLRDDGFVGVVIVFCVILVEWWLGQ